MSSDRDSIYYSPPPPPHPPPVLPILLNNFSSQITSHSAPVTLAHPSCTVVSVVPYACTQTPEQELIGTRDRLWGQEGTQEPPTIACYRFIEPILQEGPKCGLVALSMASSCTIQPLSVEYLLQEARSRRFTNHGEMFSVENMASLAHDVLGPHCREIEVLTDGLSQNNGYVLHSLLLGSLLLVPYDADANHTPCCRRGHKAHWALVVGVIISALPARSIYLLARQGKSRHLALWSYEDLRISNENLVELDPSRAIDGRSYILPIGGVAAGLKGRALLLHGLGV